MKEGLNRRTEDKSDAAASYCAGGKEFKALSAAWSSAFFLLLCLFDFPETCSPDFRWTVTSDENLNEYGDIIIW